MPFSPHPPQAPEARSRPARDREVLLAALLTVAITALFLQAPRLVRQPHLSLSGDILYLHALLRSTVLLVGGLLVGWLLQPSAEVVLCELRDRLRPRTRQVLIWCAAAFCALLIAALLVAFGRQQFGAWDFGILIETGYRQLLGQRPYVDFAAPTPPFFNWTAALAFRLFGLSWDALLLFAALFSIVTLLWSFLLLRRLGLSAIASLGTAVVAQLAAMLTTAFWWYNNSTLLLAALFFAASLLLVRTPRSALAQISFVVLLSVLPLTKPNIAGPMGAGCVFLVLLCSPRRGRVALLVLAGALGCGLLLAALHVSVPAMLATYRGIARERGGFSTFGFQELSSAERAMVPLWTLALFSPLLFLFRPLRHALRTRRWNEAAFLFFFPLAALVSLYGLLGNGEYRDVEFPPLLFALALLAFQLRRDNDRARRLTVALMCAMAVSDLYVGAARLRVYTVGTHTFFEWGHHDVVFREGFLQNLHASRTLAETDDELRRVVATNPGPVFLGPRLDFEYPALGLPSPKGWATFFQPGTAFGRETTPALLQAWRNAHFATLVFLKEDYPFYPDELLQFIARNYIRDDRYKQISVYRRRPGF